MEVPFIDLRPTHLLLLEDLEREIRSIFQTSQFVMGPRVRKLEELLAQYLGVKHAIGVASGSDALLLALMALEIGEGDEVITTPFTFFSTVSAIIRVGGRPVFVDIDPETFNLNEELIPKLITERTRVIIPVHLFGLPCEMERIMEISKEAKLKVVEDAAQALGAYCFIGEERKKAGSIGHLGCFSFYPTKNLGGAGDGGLVVTDSDELAEKIKLLRSHGARDKYLHELIGINSRLDEIQAAVLLVKLPYLDQWNEERRRKAEYYHSLFQEYEGEKLGIKLPPLRKGHVFHQYVIRTPKRDELRKYLAQKGIGTEVYYPLPLHLQPSLKFLGYRKGDFPETERASQEVLALPIYPELSPQAQRYVVQEIVSFLRESTSP
jgi:dTDP-4-amino-4,6-dideoxygalactose transaminase